MNSKFLHTIVLLLVASQLCAQTRTTSWQPDKGDGTYENPVVNADYSDPDAIRVGDDYYMISSSFNHVPGLPILHSKDLVNWTLIGHALKELVPGDHFSKVQHGGGVWAPSIRYHNNEFYIYYPDPDFGIYLIKSKNILGPWSEPIMVQEGKGLIDPCPLWDDNGKVYLVHAYAGSRAGIKSIIVVKELNTAGTKVISDPVLVYDGHEKDPTIEGPKFYKRNGYYYIFAPAGGVSTGWQTVLRSKNIYGPYERKVVMDQGSSPINGPHQGAWVDTKTGENWFLHFQDKDAYGRVVHLQPMKWVNDWPVIGTDKDGDGKGEPVLTYKKPDVGKSWPQKEFISRDDFDSPRLDLLWQWQANPQEGWAFPTANGTLRMFPAYQPDSVKGLWNLPNILAQKIQGQEVSNYSIKFNFFPKTEGERFGLVVFGLDYAALSVEKRADGNYIIFTHCKDADKNGTPVDSVIRKFTGNNIMFRIDIEAGGVCDLFMHSVNGQQAEDIPFVFKMRPGKWVGAKIGMYYTRKMITNDGGYVDIDWFKAE